MTIISIINIFIMKTIELFTDIILDDTCFGGLGFGAHPGFSPPGIETQEDNQPIAKDFLVQASGMNTGGIYSLKSANIMVRYWPFSYFCFRFVFKNFDS